MKYQIVTQVRSPAATSKPSIWARDSCMGCTSIHRLPTRLSMSLTPVSRDQFSVMVPTKVTPDQWRAYWGVNKTDRLQRILESLLLAYGGAWLAWFLAFMTGGAVSNIVGTLLMFNWMYSPWLVSDRNNRLIREDASGRPLRHAYFSGQIDSVKKAKRRTTGSVGAVVTQQYLILNVIDEEGRALEVVTPWQESYEQLRVGMTYHTLIASALSDFSVITALTDGYAPAADVWVGDYPYVVKSKFRRFASVGSVDSSGDDYGGGSGGEGSDGSGGGGGSGGGDAVRSELEDWQDCDSGEHSKNSEEYHDAELLGNGSEEGNINTTVTDSGGSGNDRDSGSKRDHGKITSDRGGGDNRTGDNGTGSGGSGAIGREDTGGSTRASKSWQSNKSGGRVKERPRNRRQTGS